MQSRNVDFIAIATCSRVATMRRMAAEEVAQNDLYIALFWVYESHSSQDSSSRIWVRASKDKQIDEALK